MWRIPSTPRSSARRHGNDSSTPCRHRHRATISVGDVDVRWNAVRSGVSIYVVGRLTKTVTMIYGTDNKSSGSAGTYRPTFGH